MTRNDCAILVPSCDGYSDLWRPFFSQFFKHWPDCPFAIHLGSDKKKFEHSRVKTIAPDAGRAWSDAVRAHLSAIATPYVLLMLDDFFLKKNVPTSTVLDRLEDLVERDGHCMRLIPRPPPDVRVPGNTEIGEISIGAAYRVSTQGAIWKRETLLALLAKGESIWSFELEGTKRSRSWSGFYGTWSHVLPYMHHVVQRGKWFPHEAARFYLTGAGVDLRARNIMGVRETARYVVGKIATGIVTRLR